MYCGASYKDNETNSLGHVFSNEYVVDIEGHYRLCTICGAKSEITKHKKDYETATTEHNVKCIDCGCVLEKSLTHIHGTNVTKEVYYITYPDAQTAELAKAAVKVEGLDNNLLELIAADPAFGMTLEELKNNTMELSKYVGRAPEQVDAFLNNVIRPILAENADVLGMKAEINV